MWVVKNNRQWNIAVQILVWFFCSLYVSASSSFSRMCSLYYSLFLSNKKTPYLTGIEWMWIVSTLLFLDALKCVENTAKESASRCWPSGNCGGASLKVLAFVETEAGAPLDALWTLQDNWWLHTSTEEPGPGYPSPSAAVRGLEVLLLPESLPVILWSVHSEHLWWPSCQVVNGCGHACDWAWGVSGLGGPWFDAGDHSHGTRVSRLLRVVLCRNPFLRPFQHALNTVASSSSLCFIDRCWGHLKTNQDFGQVHNLSGWQE